MVGEEDERTRFLLEEYEQLWNQARHIDEHQERVPRFFLIVAGAVLAGLAAFTRDETLSAASYKIGGGGLIAIGLVGLFASLSIPRFRVVRNEYFNAMYKIRGYFQDRFPDLAPSLWFPTKGIFDGYSKADLQGYTDFR